MKLYNYLSATKRNAARVERRYYKSLKRVLGTRTGSNTQFSEKDLAIAKFIILNDMTMVSVRGLLATISACKYTVANGIAGDFLECGVWRGGNAIAAKMIFDEYGSNKKVYLFDTFAGMTKPTEFDFSIRRNSPAMPIFLKGQKENHNEMCYASLADVKNNFGVAGVDLANVHFVQGDVLETLADKTNLPTEIAVLRLDTDWYESSKYELEILYPLLSVGGVLLLDDYGFWAGQRKATDDYFAGENHITPMLHIVSSAGRAAIKL